MATNPLLRLRNFGQSVWLDFIRRGMLLSGEFKTMIDQDGLLGVTSNPSIFEKSITGSRDYNDAIRAAALEGKKAKEIYDLLTISDIQKAADLFHQTFEKTDGTDGFVSLEVSPHLANETEGTVAEARRLWGRVGRANVLIKVPATRQGVPAIRQLISEGINVNVTLLFGLERYNEVIEAYISGLESRVAEGKSVKGIISVASFFLSRIDLAVDALLPKASELRGQIAIASAKMAYQKYKNQFATERFKKLLDQNAKTQRLLWASTSTKNAVDSDIKYVEALIGPETINTLPIQTMNAYRDHGDPAIRLESDLVRTSLAFDMLKEANVDLLKVTQRLEDEGVHKFSSAFDKLMTALEVKRKGTLGEAALIPPLTLTNCEDVVRSRVERLEAENYCQRVWRKDTTLWKSDLSARASIRNSLGWLHIAETMEGSLVDEINDFVKEIRAAGFKHVVHMGMGGSSLAPLVFARTFSSKNGLPLTVLDTTNPSTINEIANSIPLAETLFIVASKSGTTAEPLAFRDYFYELVRQIKGDKAGDNFVAITDPQTPLVKEAEQQRFRRTFLNSPDIGGRYSALSYFGLVPAALLGVNVSEILIRALQSTHSSLSCVAGRNSDALVLGATLGEMGLQKKNKVTLLVEKSVASLGLWLEQLMAESTGKDGSGLIPISDEPLGKMSDYGDDRLFIYLTVRGTERDADDRRLNEIVTGLKKTSHPVVTIEMSDPFDLGREFFQWEFATAVAGSVLGINPFNQPNVQESKDNTDRLLSQTTQKIHHEKPSLSDGSIGFYTPLQATSGSELLRDFFSNSARGDYVAFLAFLPETQATYQLLQAIRKIIRDRLRFATTFSYGPRFLHSTGQLHKGGPNTGLFLQLTADDITDVNIPGKPYSFAVFKNAQAQGDLEALRKHGRRAMRIHLGRDVERGLHELESMISNALRQTQ